jgi:hypothetical protein
LKLASLPYFLSSLSSVAFILFAIPTIFKSSRDTHQSTKMATQAYLERYRQLSALDQQKNDFIEELLQRVTALENSFQQEKLDHERETRFNREVQVHEMELMDQISVVKKMMVSKAVDALSKRRLTYPFPLPGPRTIRCVAFRRRRNNIQGRISTTRRTGWTQCGQAALEISPELCDDNSFHDHRAEDNDQDLS